MAVKVFYSFSRYYRISRDWQPKKDARDILMVV
uniref:Uncharacterized protein n=1 Tax=Siphoviridae sp. ctgN495 TaxID=2825608 RepID=A0A8S5UCH6_9CAUD|nr:MAG TPA: hypothetical protein [Siphoviridae sp. ctgN495]